MSAKTLEVLGNPPTPPLRFPSTILKHWISFNTGNRDDIEWHDLQRSYYRKTSCSVESVWGNTALGTVFLDTLPSKYQAHILTQKNIGNVPAMMQIGTMRHLQESKMSSHGCTNQTKLKQYKQNPWPWASWVQGMYFPIDPSSCQCTDTVLEY